MYQKFKIKVKLMEAIKISTQLFSCLSDHKGDVRLR